MLTEGDTHHAVIESAFWFVLVLVAAVMMLTALIRNSAECMENPCHHIGTGGNNVRRLQDNSKG